MSNNLIQRLFLAAPLSILPLLSTMNRLDLFDLYKAQQEAKTNNRMAGECRLLYIGNDSLLLQTSSVSLWGLRVLPDSTLQLTRTVCVPDTLTHTQRFTKQWKVKR